MNEEFKKRSIHYYVGKYVFPILSLLIVISCGLEFGISNRMYYSNAFLALFIMGLIVYSFSNGDFLDGINYWLNKK